MDIIDLIIVFAIGYFVGKIHAYVKMVRALHEAADDAGIDLEKTLKLKPEEEPKKDVYRLEVEQVNNMLYLYDKESHDFICQGSTLQELAKLAKDYKNIKLAAVLHGDKLFTFTDGVSKEFTV